MILPLYDENSDRRIVPWVNYSLLAANVFVFLVLQGGGTNLDFTFAWATVPEEIVTGKDVVTEPKTVETKTGLEVPIPGLRPTPVSVYLTLLTSMFMHGGWLHLLGNMLFLWIFGDNVEDRLGHLRYLLFYLACGILASLAHVFATAALGGDMFVPALGASGAISGVLGAYALLHPQRPVTVLVIRLLVQMPAWMVVGLWFAFQLINSLGALGEGSQSGGVAYGAHIGGFLAGVALTFLVAPRR